MSGQAMLAGIHRSLKDSDTPWQDRLKLARFAWCSSQCFLPNKQQVLLDWVCNALANQTKFLIPDDVIRTLWQYLHDVLHSKQLQQATESSSIAVSIRDAIYPVFCSALNINGKYVTKAAACCHVILQSSCLCRTLIAKYDLMLDLLSTTMSLVTKCLETGNPLQETAVACLQILLKKFGVSHRQKQLQAHKKAFTTVYEKLLIPALHLYTSENASGQTTIKTQIEDLIGTGVFNKEMCGSYTKYLTADRQSLDEKDKHHEAHFNDIDTLMEFLAKECRNAESKDASSRTLAGLPVLYTAFIAAYKPSADVMFAMCKKLCGIMGILPDSQDSGIESSASCAWQQALPALEEILKTVLTNDIYVVAFDNAGGKPKFKWFLKLLQMLLNHADRCSVSFFNCLHILLDLNHLIVEDELTLIWNVSLVQQVSKHPDDGQKVDKLEESRTEFLGALMRTYTKLRQFDKLVEHLVASYRDGASTSGQRFSFHPGFVHRFCECIQELPPGLTLDLWKLFKENLVNSYINPLSESVNQEPPKKKKRRSTHENIMAALEQVAVTFHLFLTAARLVDLSATVAMMDRLETLVEEMQTNVVQPLHDVCQNMKNELNESLSFSTLLLTYTMGELQLILLQHTTYGSRHTKYDAGKNDGEKTPPAIAILKSAKCMGDFLNVECLEKVDDVLSTYDRSVGKKNRRILHLLHLLRTQQARAVLLYTQAGDHSNMEAIMQKLSDKVLAGDVNIDSGGTCTTWDGQIASISKNNYATAYLHFLTQTFSIWLPDTTPQQHFQVASLLVQAFNGDVTPQGTSDAMTLGGVASAFLCSDVCMESKELQTALLVAVLTSLGHLLFSSRSSPKKTKKSKKSNDVTMKCGQLLGMLSQVTDNQDDNWETLETVGREYSAMLENEEENKGNRLKKMDDLVKNVDNVLNVLGQLPLAHLLPGNQDRCMLGLVIIDTMLTGWLATDNISCYRHLIGTILLCRNLEGKILQAMRSTGLLKCFNVGVMLASIISKHSEGWKYLMETNKLNQDGWRNNYMELDDITQKLILQWMQKVEDRSSHEGSIIRDVTSLLRKKLSVLKDQIAEESSSASDLWDVIPLFSTSINIIQWSLSSHQPTREGKTRVPAKHAKRLCTSLQQVLRNVVSHTQGDIDPLLVGCLAKTTAGLMTSVKLTNQDGGNKLSNDVDMEVDDISPVAAVKNSKHLSQSLEVVSKHGKEILVLWDDVVYPVLHAISGYLESNYVAKCYGQRSVANDLATVEGVGRRTADTLPACLDYMKALCEFVTSHKMSVHGKVIGRTWKHLVALMSATEEEDVTDHVMSTASYALACMDRDHFSDVIEHCLGTLGATELSPDRVTTLKACVLTLQMTCDCQLDEEKQEVLQDYVPKMLVSLQCLLVEAVRDWSTGGTLAVCILTVIHTMVSSAKKLLEPKQAMQTLQACLTVQFTSVPDALFPSVFSTLYLVMRSLLQAFPQTVLHCMAVYMATVQHMLSGIMHRSHQQLQEERDIGDQELFTCAENVERLLTQISSHKKDVGKFVIVLVSEYISELQKGTLLPFIKKTLVVGVYNLVDICDEKALALLQATLPLNLKEIYTEFYNDYKKYHKYKGKV